MSYSNTRIGTYLCFPTTTVYPSIVVPPYVDTFPIRHFVPPIKSGLVMSSSDQNFFEGFIWFSPVKFNGLIGENAYEFLLNC